MTPINLNQFSPAPLEEEEDLSHPRISILPINPFSFSCPIFINTPPEATDIHHHQIYYYQPPPEGRTAISSSSSNSSDGLLPFSSKEEAYYNGYTSTKKVISSKSSGSNSNFNVSVVRTCSDCNTAKTPLWRSGPRGPKSLCNACGIRQRKARRAIAASATVGNAPSLVQREKNSDCYRTVPYKKRWKFTAFDCSEH